MDLTMQPNIKVQLEQESIIFVGNLGLNRLTKITQKKSARQAHAQTIGLPV